MFCPRINGECRKDCVKWDSNLGKCQEQVIAEVTIKANQVVDYMLQVQRVTWRLQIRSLLNDPMVPSDVKEAIQETKDIAALEKLLGNAGLLD